MKKRRYKVILMVLTVILSAFLAGCNQKKEDIAGEASTMVVAQGETEETTKYQTEDFSILLNSSNSWENNGMVCTQFEGKIKNLTEAAGKDWKVTVTVPEEASLENGWNGTYSIQKTILEITPVDYNTEIGAGQEVTFGFIIDTKEAFAPEEVMLSIDGRNYSMKASGAGQIADKKAEETGKAGDSREKASENVKTAGKDVNGTPLENHGALAVKGTDIVDKNGEVYQLKGVSTHGINWFPDYVNKGAFASLSQYGVNAIRLAMYTADYNGYCSGGKKEGLEALIDKGVAACSELGMYVIIDWHILNDNNPNQNKDSAKLFFERMSKKYADYDNVLYEICNEPNGGTTWEDIKKYSEEVIPVIRKQDKDAIIIVGTPNWSQDVDIASENRIEGYDNIIYAAHFYASTHKEEIRSKIKKARENGLPVIISECSVCDASGDGSIDYPEADRWMDMIDLYHLSFFAWNLSNKEEQSSLLKPSVTKTENFEDADFSDTGAWFLKQFNK